MLLEKSEVKRMGRLGPEEAASTERLNLVVRTWASTAAGRRGETEAVSERRGTQTVLTHGINSTTFNPCASLMSIMAEENRQHHQLVKNDLSASPNGTFASLVSMKVSCDSEHRLADHPNHFLHRPSMGGLSTQAH